MPIFAFLFRAKHFYPRPPCGGRPGVKFASSIQVTYFYPRPPCGGRRLPVMDGANKAIFLSTSPLRGTTMFGLGLYIYAGISIHVPLAGDDKSALRGWLRLQYFYPRPPCGGRPQTVRRQSLCTTISIHVPLAGDDILSTSLIGIARISIHVPLAGDDAAAACALAAAFYFYPRPPCGGRRGLYRTPPQITSFLSTSPLRGTT